MRKPNVGLIGLGAMGKGVAENLVRNGFPLHGYDVRKEERAFLEHIGGIFADDLPALARKCQVLISFVVNEEQTEEILFGEQGILTTLSSGSIFIACSTMSPKYVEQLGARLMDRSIEFLDAPVTGGAAGAKKGSLTIITAGKKEVYRQVHDVLSAFGARLYHVSDRHGAGAQLKVINQLLCGVHLAAAGEALALAKRQGLPMHLTHEILCSGAAFSWMLGDRGPRMVSEDFGQITSAINIFVKDLGLVLDTARSQGYAAPLASAAHNAFLAVSGGGKGWWDDSAVMLHYNHEMNISPVNPPAKKYC